MGKKLIIVLSLICLASVLLNGYQYKKSMELKQDQKFYDEKYKNDINDLVKTFDLYTTGGLSNECAIKNSVSAVESMETIREFTSYKNNKSLSLMGLYLSDFFILKSNEFINKNVNEVKGYLMEISKGLDDNQKIDNLNSYLWEKIKK